MLIENVTIISLKNTPFALLPEAYAPFDPLIDVVIKKIKNVF